MDARRPRLKSSCRRLLSRARRRLPTLSVLQASDPDAPGCCGLRPHGCLVEGAETVAVQRSVANTLRVLSQRTSATAHVAASWCCWSVASCGPCRAVTGDATQSSFRKSGRSSPWHRCRLVLLGAGPFVTKSVNRSATATRRRRPAGGRVRAWVHPPRRRGRRRPGSAASAGTSLTRHHIPGADLGQGLRVGVSGPFGDRDKGAGAGQYRAYRQPQYRRQPVLDPPRRAGIGVPWPALTTPGAVPGEGLTQLKEVADLRGDGR